MTMPVRPEKQQALEETLKRLNIKKGEVVEQFVRSQGAGGQKVNKASTAVYLKHRPTGIEVKMQKERSQALNRFLAWRLLAEKIEAYYQGAGSGDREAERIRKQKDRRRRRAKGGRPSEEKSSRAPAVEKNPEGKMP